MRQGDQHKDRWSGILSVHVAAPVFAFGYLFVLLWSATALGMATPICCSGLHAASPVLSLRQDRLRLSLEQAIFLQKLSVNMVIL